MAHFLFVHGSCHGAWCWDRVLPELSKHGHSGHAIDLPSHGQDTTPVQDVTLDLYANAILGELDRQTFLVGHSMAGYPITRAAEIDPTHVAGLIYLCAYVPITGLSLADHRNRAPSAPLKEAIRVSKDRQSFTIDPRMARDKFYHDCDATVADWAISQLCPQPILPQETAFNVTTRSRTIARAYIKCNDDRTIPPEYQSMMAKDFDPRFQWSMQTSHSPFLSNPGELSAHLSDISAIL